MGIMVYSLLRVMQDLYHQPYNRTLKLLAGDHSSSTGYQLPDHVA